MVDTFRDIFSEEVGEARRANRDYRKIKECIAYMIFGLCNNFGYVVMLTAAADIVREQGGGTGNSVSISIQGDLTKT